MSAYTEQQESLSENLTLFVLIMPSPVIIPHNESVWGLTKFVMRNLELQIMKV